MFKRGEWVELRDAPNTRGVLLHVFNADATILLSGDRDLTSISVRELEALWEPMQFNGDLPPFWCHEKAMFRPRDITASMVVEIKEVRPGWVSYYVRLKKMDSMKFLDGDPQFFMSRWWEFRAQFEPMQPPSAWDHLLNGGD